MFAIILFLAASGRAGSFHHQVQENQHGQRRICERHRTDGGVLGQAHPRGSVSVPVVLQAASTGCSDLAHERGKRRAVYAHSPLFVVAGEGTTVVGCCCCVMCYVMLCVLFLWWWLLWAWWLLLSFGIVSCVVVVVDFATALVIPAVLSAGASGGADTRFGRRQNEEKIMTEKNDTVFK